MREWWRKKKPSCLWCCIKNVSQYCFTWLTLLVLIYSQISCFFFHSQTAYFTVIDSHYKDLLRRILSVQRVVLFIELLYIQYQILYEVSHTSKEIWVFSLYILINWSHTAFTRVYIYVIQFILLYNIILL